MIRAILLITLFASSRWAVGQSLRSDQLIGTWIGLYYALDTDYFVPTGSYLQLDADGNCQLGALNQQEEPIRKQWSVANGALRIDTLQFRPGQVRLSDDVLTINGFMPLAFRRFQDISISADSAHVYLQNAIWTDGAKRYHFHANGQACLEYPATHPTAPGDRTVHQWSVVPHQRSAFLIVKGVAQDEVGNYQPVIQLTKTGKRSFTGIGFDSTGHVNAQTFRFIAPLSPDSVCRPIGFQPCQTYLYPSMSMYYSYDKKGHQDRLRYIQNVFSDSFKPVSGTNQSGLVRIRFQVNCRGEAGRFDLLELDTSYQKCPFDKRVSGQLLAICRKSLATGWLPAQSNRNPANRNEYVQFITVRLKDGTITEIFP